MTHEQMMSKAWNLIHDLGITEDCEEFAKNLGSYLVENINTVRDAFYSDIENDIKQDEDTEKFFTRHGIKWE